MISAANVRSYGFPLLVRELPYFRVSAPTDRPRVSPYRRQSIHRRRHPPQRSLVSLQSSSEEPVTTTWTVKPVASDEELLDFLQLVLQGYFEPSLSGMFQDDHSRYVQTFMRQRLESEVQRLKEKYQPSGDKHPESLCLVAVGDRSEVVGGCEVCVSQEMCGISPIGVPAADKNGFYIQNLIVATDHRRKGVGNAVMQTMMDGIKEMDASAVYAHVEAHNDGAVEFYKRLGFEIVEEVASVDPEANLGRVMLLKKDLSEPSTAGV